LKVGSLEPMNTRLPPEEIPTSIAANYFTEMGSRSEYVLPVSWNRLQDNYLRRWQLN
jgi:hypothetical protein